MDWKEYIENAAKQMNFSEERTESLIGNLEANKGILKELRAYIQKGELLCEYKVKGYSIADILVWQIDHFRARLDRDTVFTRENPMTMMVLAVEKMIEISKDDKEFSKAFGEETGTDFIV
ncbi:MAG: hypothetical protein K6F84_06040 [Lachnospiraceae bacterium]|nr:hypothetical protein [Lachnospiraceae bacterium]